jgi:hypothetical protein
VNAKSPKNIARAATAVISLDHYSHTSVIYESLFWLP